MNLKDAMDPARLAELHRELAVAHAALGAAGVTTRQRAVLRTRLSVLYTQLFDIVGQALGAAPG